MAIPTAAVTWQPTGICSTEQKNFTVTRWYRRDFLYLYNMKEVSLNINVPADIFVAFNESKEEFKKELTLSAAIWMYKTEKLSLTKAAALAGFHRYDFEKILAENEIPITLLSVPDILNDISKM